MICDLKHFILAFGFWILSIVKRRKPIDWDELHELQSGRYYRVKNIGWNFTRRLYKIYYTFYLHSWFPPTEQNLLHFILTFLVSSDCTKFTTLSTYILGFLRLYKIYYTFYLHSWFPPTVNFFPHCHIFHKLLYLLRLYLRHKNNF